MSDQTHEADKNSNSDIKSHLLGCLEAAIFMPSCAKRFSGSASAVKKSFIIPLLILPITLATVILAHPHADITSSTQKILMGIYSLRLFVSLSVFLGIVYFISKGMDRLKQFNQFVTANNWLTLPAAIISLPLLIAFMNGHYSWEEIYPLMVCITIYSYIYSGFMITHVLRVPWEFACFIAIIGMAVQETSLDIIKWAAVQTAYLVS